MNAQSTPVLAIDSLRVEYPLANGSVFTAVENASLIIRPGEIHALVGESGAGKTTIGNAVMGLLEKPGRIAAGTHPYRRQAVRRRQGLGCRASCSAATSAPSFRIR